jgi:hypothetical protein
MRIIGAIMTRRTLRQPAAALGIAALIIAGATAAWSAQPPRDGRLRFAQAAASPTTEAASWQKVSGPEQSFSAEMPAAPKYTSQEMRTAAGSPYTMHQYLLEQGNVAYVAQTAIYPADVNVSNHRTNLQGGLDNAAKNMEGGKWASVGWTTHQGLTAVDAVGVRDSHAIRSFSVMKGRQIVTLTYAGPAGSARTADVDRFIGSLRVGP